MSKPKPTLNEIIEQMKEWHREATAWRNDGYVQDGYKEKLDTLHARITEIMADALINPVPMEQEERFKEGTLDIDDIEFVYRSRPDDNKDN